MARALWEMTLDEFGATASRGRLVLATGKRVPGEMFARTPLRMGELNNYGNENIAHFYVSRRRDVAMGYEEMMADAVTEGRL